MIAQLTGTIVEVTPLGLILDVHGVGYQLGISSTTAAALPPAGTPDVCVLTHLAVRENAIDLYGFATREERTLFLKLTGISGVGPALALSVLSTYTPARLAVVVASEDLAALTSIPRVGKKMAGRLLLELQDLFSKDAGLRSAISSASDVASVPVSAGSASAADEVRAALLSMGFTDHEAALALEGHESAVPSGTIEAVLAYALKRLGGGA